MARWNKLARISGLVMLPLLLGQSCASTPSNGTDGADGTNGATGATGPAGSMGDIGPIGDTGLTGAIGPMGLPGTNGTNGADGQLRIYGDGSAGDLNVSTTGTLATIVPSGNLQFHSFLVETGVTLSVPSGTTLRCTGTFTNNGTIEVATGESSGGNGGSPGAGVAHAPAADSSRSADTSLVLFGAGGGVGLTSEESNQLLMISPSGGGAGGGNFGPSNDPGGHGGGALLVLSMGAIINASTGLFRANGESPTLSGGGGGAGGIIILASRSSVTNLGQLLAHGGNGVSALLNTSGSGGGGGGIIHLLAPAVLMTGGSINVDAGTGGSAGTGSNTSRTTGAGVVPAVATAVGEARFSITHPIIWMQVRPGRPGTDCKPA